MTLSIIFSAASLILCGFFFLYFRSYLKKRISPEGLLEDYQDEVNKLISDIDAATDRDTYLVEERIKSLKSLMEEVDRKIGVYIQEFDRRRNSEAVYTALGRKSAQTAAPPRPDPLREPKIPGSEEPSVQAAGPSASAGAVSPEPAPPKPRPLREQIAELAAQGLSPAVISARLKVSLSEVELALAIQNRSTTC
ncbi:MAG: hypothetical protein LBD78_04115 [Spirochaetaceae bacterium]|jgi:hypothetical protein|nr:hypothetical protein [Spirochaetaceae bacterium]